MLSFQTLTEKLPLEYKWQFTDLYKVLTDSESSLNP